MATKKITATKTAAKKKTTATKTATKSTAKKVTKAVAKKNLVPLKDRTPSKESLVPIKDKPTPKKESLAPIRDRYVPLEYNTPKGSGAVKGAVAGAKEMRYGFDDYHSKARGNAVRRANGLKKIYK